MIRRPPRSTLDRSSAASDVYKRQEDVDQKEIGVGAWAQTGREGGQRFAGATQAAGDLQAAQSFALSLIHISEPTRPY